MENTKYQMVKSKDINHADRDIRGSYLKEGNNQENSKSLVNIYELYKNPGPYGATLCIV